MQSRRDDSKLTLGSGVGFRDPSPAMGYRIYFFDRDQHITARVDLDCTSDEEAIERVKARYRDDRIMELWKEPTRIASFPGKPPG